MNPSNTSVPVTLTLFDDEHGENGLNGQPAAAQPIRELTDALNHIALRPRPVFSFWGGGPLTAGQDIARLVESWWAQTSPSAWGIRGHALIVPSTAQPVASQGVSFSHGTPTITAVGKTDADAQAYPGSCEAVSLGASHRTDRNSLAFENIFVGGSTSNSPRVESGVMYEPRRTIVDHLIRDAGGGARQLRQTHVPTDWLSAGSPILGTPGTFAAGSSSLSDSRGFSSLNAFLRSVHKGRRLSGGWSTVLPDTNYAAVTGNEFRYIWDTRFGEGGTAPSQAGPGICVPLRYSSTGRRTAVRLYVALRAHVTAGTGAFGFYHQNADGSFAGPTSVVTVTTTDPNNAWHLPATSSGGLFTFSATNAQRIELNTERAYNKIVPVAKCDGGTIRIQALMFFVFHSAA